MNSNGPGLELQGFDTVLGILNRIVDDFYVIAVGGTLGKTLERQLVGVMKADATFVRASKISDVVESFNC